MSLNYFYRFADFTLRSEWELADLWPVVPDTAGVSVWVERGVVTDLPDTGGAPVQQGVCYQCTPTAFMLRTPVATFAVHDGCRVTVEPVPGVPEADMQPFISGPVMAMLCYQRGLFVLHGCALWGGSRVLVLAGHSSCGKSTLGYGLMEQGWQLLADDVVPVSIINNEVTVLPGRRGVHLWEDAVEYFQVSLPALCRVRSGLRKYTVYANHDDAVPRPVVLDDVLLIPVGNASASVQLKRTAATAAFDRLLTHGCYRPSWIDGMQRRKRFDYCAAIARQAGIYELAFPQFFTWLPEVVRQVRACAAGGVIDGSTVDADG